MAKYIDANKLSAEIERLYDGEAPAHDQQCDFDDGYFTGIAAISKFIDSLPEEQPEDFNDAFDKYMKEEWSHGTQLNDIARHFYELGQASVPMSEEKLGDDLDEAADEYEKNHTHQQYDGGGFTPEYNATLAEAFQAGAEWQKEQMMKETIEGEISLTNIGDDSYIKTLRMPELRKAIQNPNLCCGKVKVIIIKDDGRED